MKNCAGAGEEAAFCCHPAAFGVTFTSGIVADDLGVGYTSVVVGAGCSSNVSPGMQNIAGEA